jgi:hypothetical protein
MQTLSHGIELRAEVPAVGTAGAGRTTAVPSTLLPIYGAARLWAGLMPRDSRLHAILPWRYRAAGRHEA